MSQIWHPDLASRPGIHIWYPDLVSRHGYGPVFRISIRIWIVILSFHPKAEKSFLRRQTNYVSQPDPITSHPGKMSLQGEPSLPMSIGSSSDIGSDRCVMHNGHQVSFSLDPFLCLSLASSKYGYNGEVPPSLCEISRRLQRTSAATSPPRRTFAES